MYDPNRLSEIMRREAVDAIAASTRENVLYLSGFDPVVRTLNPYHGVCWVVVTQEDPTKIHVLTSVGEADQILDAVMPVGECQLYGTFFREIAVGTQLLQDELSLLQITSGTANESDPITAIVRLISRLGLKSSCVAIDEDGVSPALLATVKARLDKCSLVDGAHILREARRVKTQNEIAALRDAAHSIELGIAACIDGIGIGASETLAAQIFETEVARTGARPALTMLKIGRAAVGGQRRQRATVCAKPGDILWFDCNVTKFGYWADIARVFAFNDGERFRNKFQALSTAQRQAMELIRPGMTGHQVFELTMSLVHKAGFSEYRRHHVGHGIGLEAYERPILAPGNQDRIEAGMVLSVETPYYEYGLGAIHIEDPILVGSSSNIVLTNVYKELRIIR